MAILIVWMKSRLLQLRSIEFVFTFSLEAVKVSSLLRMVHHFSDYNFSIDRFSQNQGSKYEHDG